MSNDSRNVISLVMGIEPIMIDASLVSAQSRKRYFWTNIPVDIPGDKGIMLKDILLKDVEDKYYIKKEMTDVSGGRLIGLIGANSQGNRVYSTNGKSVTLSANGGGLGAKTGLYKIGRDIGRRLDDNGTRKDDDKTIAIQRRIEVRDDDKCGTLTSVMKDNLVVGNGIRKLTPVECERLQGLCDGYTEGISDNQRYKCLGNAFNVDVVSYILSKISIC
jgi:DNA (cytosine-5)-methyltransferase 3A